MAEKNVFLNTNDLKLFMDNYQNIVKLCTITIEQQKQIIELQKQIITKQESTVSDHIKGDSKLESITSKLQEQAHNIEKVNTNVTTSHSDTQSVLKDIQTSSAIEHGKIGNKLYVSVGSMVTIIMSLIGYLWIANDNFSQITLIKELLQKLLTHFGISV